MPKYVPYPGKQAAEEERMRKLINKAWHLLFGTEKGKYLVVGALTTLVSFIAFALAFYLFHLNETLSTVVKNAAGIAFAYYPNRRWVFESGNKSTAAISKESLLFFVTRIVVLLLDMVLMQFLPGLIGFLPYHELIASVISTVICLILNYVASKIYIFTGKEKK